MGKKKLDRTEKALFLGLGNGKKVLRIVRHPPHSRQNASPDSVENRRFFWEKKRGALRWKKRLF